MLSAPPPSPLFCIAHPLRILFDDHRPRACGCCRAARRCALPPSLTASLAPPPPSPCVRACACVSCCVVLCVFVPSLLKKKTCNILKTKSAFSSSTTSASTFNSTSTRSGGGGGGGDVFDVFSTNGSTGSGAGSAGGGRSANKSWAGNFIRSNSFMRSNSLPMTAGPDGRQWWERENVREKKYLHWGGIPVVILRT